MQYSLLNQIKKIFRGLKNADAVFQTQHAQNLCKNITRCYVLWIIADPEIRREALIKSLIKKAENAVTINYLVEWNIVTGILSNSIPHFYCWFMIRQKNLTSKYLKIIVEGNLKWGRGRKKEGNTSQESI